ncbi:hypothetical protein HDU97_004773 [Phlyctochytrium planicorne]|nr:hypothetical protein HDU97_004773 [Phlyctochytrium planicorne]
MVGRVGGAGGLGGLGAMTELAEGMGGGGAGGTSAVGGMVGELFGGGQQGEALGNLAVSIAFPEVGMALQIMEMFMGPDSCGKGGENENKTDEQKIKDYDIDNDPYTNDTQKDALNDVKDAYYSLNGDYSLMSQLGPCLQIVGDSFGNPQAGKDLADLSEKMENRYNDNMNDNENTQENTQENQENENQNEDLEKEHEGLEA